MTTLSNSTDRYIHTENVHNLSAPNELVPVLMQLFNPLTVADLGCGIGTFLNVFKKQGVQKVLGIDGPWVDRSLLQKHIALNEFAERDLRNAFQTESKFDLVLSLEVAEHIEKEYTDVYMDNLVGLGDTIVFSAAIPGQDGQNHVNLQWPQYWVQKFMQRSFQCYDILRPMIWNNDNIDWWYRQNIFVASRKDLSDRCQHLPNGKEILSLVHPAVYSEMINERKNMEAGNYSLRWYIGSLKKSLSRKLFRKN